MARSRGFHQGNARVQRRQTGWEEGPGGTPVQTINASVKRILNSGAQALVDGLTLIRTRGYFSSIQVIGSAIGDGFSGAFGIGVVTNDAFAIGVTAMPGPLSNIDWDGWLYHRFISQHVAAANAFGTEDSVLTFEVDSKAMRKITVNDTVFAMLEVTEIGTAEIDVFFDSRMLLKLP